MTNTGRRLNIPGIIAHFGGQSNLHRLLKKHGITVSSKTVEAWSYRGSIPANRLASLVDIAGITGKPLDISTFYVTPKEA